MRPRLMVAAMGACLAAALVLLEAPSLVRRPAHGLPTTPEGAAIALAFPVGLFMSSLAFAMRPPRDVTVATAGLAIASIPQAGALWLLARGVVFPFATEAPAIALVAAALLAVIVALSGLRALAPLVGVLVAVGLTRALWLLLAAALDLRSGALFLAESIATVAGVALVCAWWLDAPRASLQEEGPASDAS